MGQKDPIFSGPDQDPTNHSKGYNSREEYVEALTAMAKNGTPNRSLRRAMKKLKRAKPRKDP